MRRTISSFAIVAVVVLAIGGAAIAAHDFNDVPDSNPFHDDISWLASNGVTGGFPDGRFHPDDPVTREQMAAFLHRLSGDGGTPRVVDAARLTDRTASDFDNAVSLQGQSPEQLQPNVHFASSTGEVAISGTSIGSASTVVTLMNLPAGTYVVSVSGTVRTTWEEAVVSCGIVGATVLAPAHSLERVHISTEENLTDYGSLSGSAVVDLAATGNVSVGCYWNGLSGVTGTLLARPTTMTATAVEDV